MVTRRVNDQLAKVLQHALQPVEIVDESGRVLGIFMPSEQQREAVLRQADELLPPEEVERRLQSEGVGCSTHELLEKLDRL